jgi:hypothetical protein
MVRRHWPHIRAVLVALHLLSVVVLSIPGSNALTNRRGWESENAKAEFRNWATRLQQLGFDVTPEEFESGLWRVNVGIGTWRDRVAWPFQHYARITGARQGWQMFATPQKVPAELHVDAMVDGQWQALVRPRDPESTWRLSQRKHNRVRKQLGRFARTFYPDRYETIARWFATAAVHDFPDATAVRVRLWRYGSLPPARVLAGEEPEGRYEHERVWQAQDLR